MSANKRIMKEYGDITAEPPNGCTIELPNESDIHFWEVTMQGPADSVYADGHFKIHVSLPKDYPFKPPTISFKTKIYHPNVSNDERGAMCLGMLRADEWKPPNKIKEVLALVRATLEAPQPDDAVEASAADEFKNNRPAFDKKAREWVAQYAQAS